MSDYTFNSSSSEIFFGLYALTGPVLDSAFLVSIISHSWSSFTFEISLLNYKAQHSLDEEGKENDQGLMIAMTIWHWNAKMMGKQ